MRRMTAWERRLVRGGEGEEDLVQLQLLEAVIEKGGGGFGGVAVAPGVAGEAPADLVAFGAGRPDGDGGQGDEAQKGAVRLALEGQEAATRLLEPRLEPVDLCVAFGPRHWPPAKPVHDLRIGAHGAVGLAIGHPPAAQDQAVGLDHAGRGAARAP